VHTERVHVSTYLVQEFAQLVHGGRHGLFVNWPLLLQAMHVVCEPFLNDPLDDMVSVLVLYQLVQFVAGPVEDGFGECVARLKTKDLLHSLHYLAAIRVKTGVY